MNKFIKILLAVFACMLAILFMLVFLKVTGVDNIARFALGAVEPDEARMEKIFSKDKQLLGEVAEYLIQKDGDIYLYTEHDFSLNGDIEFSDEKHLKKISNLMIKEGYSVIVKKGKEIHFQYWENLDAGKGFSYCADGQPPKTLQFLIYNNFMGDNWYYYEEDFNEWKSKKQ